MKRILYTFVLLLSSLSLSATGNTKPSFVYDLDFEMRFDNREFATSCFTPSMTIFGARLTPQVGLALTEKNGARHRIMAGIDVMKDFGSGKDLDLFQEIQVYYNLRKKINKTDLEIYAGIFPRKLSGGLTPRHSSPTPSVSMTTTSKDFCSNSEDRQHTSKWAVTGWDSTDRQDERNS